jgi:hypothetical protein
MSAWWVERIAADAKGPLFRTVARDGKLTANPLHRVGCTGRDAVVNYDHRTAGDL